MERKIFSGIMPALVSPVDDDGTVREDALRALVEALARTGITGLYLCGGTGEGVALAPDTRMRIVQIVADQNRGRLRLIDHVAAGDLTTARALAAHAASVGVDGLASVPPFFYRYDEAGILAYYRGLSEASGGLPMIMYASPFSGDPLPPSTVEKMLAIPGMIGLKWTNPDYYRMRALVDLNGGNINVINGPDETLVLGLLMGADGGIGSTYNLIPRLYVALYERTLAGDWAGARELQLQANRLIALALATGNVIGAVKAGLDAQGFAVGEPTRPLPRLDAAARKRLLEGFTALGFIDKYKA